MTTTFGRYAYLVEINKHINSRTSLFNEGCSYSGNGNRCKNFCAPNGSKLDI